VKQSNEVGAEGDGGRRLRFAPADLEDAFQRDYLAKWLPAMRRGALASAVLMLPAAFHNYSIGLWPAVWANLAAFGGCFAYLALLSRAGGARWWQSGGFLLACLDTFAFFYVGVTAVPRLPHVRSPEHAADTFLLVQVVLLVYMFVVGRFQTRWYAAYALVSVVAGPIFVAVALPTVLGYLVGGMSVSVLAVAALLVLLAYYQERTARGEFLANHLLAAERDKSERLLLNILPGPIAHRLKAGGSVTLADDFEQVGVLFADIVEFTPLAASLPAAEVVGLLNRIFTAFDELAEKHGMEKIKTIGDAYMAAAGLPEPRQDHAAALAWMALDMRAAVGEFRRASGEPLALRIGLNVGPVVAGVIGTKKFIYDLWGDTVNVASRMESHGQPGTIQVTEAAHALLRDRFAFGPPYTVDIKGRGAMTAYVLLGPLPSGESTSA
jgi:class 3 adenylate cyclase